MISEPDPVFLANALGPAGLPPAIWGGSDSAANVDAPGALVASGSRAVDAPAAERFPGEHPERRAQLQDAAFAARNFTLFHQLSQPAAGRTRVADVDGTPVPVAAAPQPEPHVNLSSSTREIGFALRHPFIAHAIGEVEHGSTNISTNAVRFATLGMPGQPGSVLRESPTHEGSQVNAFRHALDLLNNRIGRSLGAQDPNASMRDLAGKVLETYHDEGLYQIVANDSSGVHIDRVRLPDDQYNAMHTLLARADDNGFLH